MATQIAGVGAAVTIPVPAGHRFAAADLEWFAEHVESRGGSGGSHGQEARMNRILPEDRHKMRPGG
jgi:hypothetical protein